MGRGHSRSDRWPDAPALADNIDAIFLEADIHEITAAAKTLQNVLDVMADACNRLADGGEPFRLHHRLIVAAVFDCQARLVSDRDH